VSKPRLEWVTADPEHAWTGSNDECDAVYFVTSTRTCVPKMWYGHIVNVTEFPRVKSVVSRCFTADDAKAACQEHWEAQK
jgi:hypothetical protein